MPVRIEDVAQADGNTQCSVSQHRVRWRYARLTRAAWQWAAEGEAHDVRAHLLEVLVSVGMST